MVMKFANNKQKSSITGAFWDRTRLFSNTRIGHEEPKRQPAVRLVEGNTLDTYVVPLFGSAKGRYSTSIVLLLMETRELSIS